MRPPMLVLASTFVLALGLTPAFAQLSGGLGSANAANQSFQQENTMRGLQQQQTFNNNQIQLNSSINRMNAAPAYGYGPGAGYYRPAARRPERER